MRSSDVKCAVKADREKYYSVETNAILYNKQIEVFRFPINQNYFEILAEYGVAIASLISRLKKIRGVDHIFVSTCEVSIHMAGLNRISDEIRKIVEDFIYLCARLEEGETPKQLALLNISRQETGQISIDVSTIITKRNLTLEKNYTERRLSGFDKEVKRLIKSLLNIEGVIKVEITYYKITIYYAPLFDRLTVAQDVVDAYIEFVK